VVSVEALPPPPHAPDAFDIRRFERWATILRHDGGEEALLLSDGVHHLQLDVIAGSLLGGPVRLHYEISGFRHVEAQILTLRRLLLLYRLGRFPSGLYPPERRARRWAMALRAYDGMTAGASHRDIAEVLFGVQTVRDDWCGRSEYLRLRVQRLLHVAHAMVEGGYRDLLKR
jgi:hypothetical protein